VPWSTAFHEPVPLPGGKSLCTLRQAADHIQRLPKPEQSRPDWQQAVDTLIHAAETGGAWVQLAHIAVLRAVRAS
jgi:hypothetical protein